MLGMPFQPGFYDDKGAFNHLVGREYVLNDPRHGTGLPTTYKLVKNSSSGALVPKLNARYDYGTTYAPYTAVNAYHFQSDIEWAGVIDDQLPSAGVPTLANFYIITDGPVLLTNSHGAMGANVAVGDVVQGVTAGSSGAATTAVGRFTSFSAAQTTHTHAQAFNVLGRALTARTTGNTNTDTLVAMRKII